MANRFCNKTLWKFQNIVSRIVRGFRLLSCLCFILTYFNISRNRSQLLHKKMHWSTFLTSCRPEVCNYIKLERQRRCFSLIFVKFLRTASCRTNVNGCFWSLGGVMEKYILEINNSLCVLLRGCAKTVSVCSFTKTLWKIIFNKFPKSPFNVTENAK